jgi:hypothetical protein
VYAGPGIGSRCLEIGAAVQLTGKGTIMLDKLVALEKKLEDIVSLGQTGETLDEWVEAVTTFDFVDLHSDVKYLIGVLSALAPKSP